MAQRFDILALSGGGYFGLYTIAVLSALENAFGGPIARYFDLLAGTSIGGIIALGLAAEASAAEIQTCFEERGTDIFSDRPAATSLFGSLLDFKRSMLRPKYNNDALRSVVCDLVGETTLIGDLKHRVIVPSVNLTKGQPQIFKTPHHSDFRIDLERKVWEVALATSAAPTFFPLAEVDNSLFADGGLYANSPDLLALHEAEHFLEVDTAAAYLLSVGTTTAQYSFSHAGGKNLGIWGWTREQRLVNVILASQQQSIAFMMKHRLNNRYLRLDVSQSKEQERHLALDVAIAAAQSTIKGLAESTVQAYISNEKLVSFFQNYAPAPRFFKKRA